MRSLLLATIAFTSTAFAQTSINYHDFWSGCTNFTSRGALGTNGGDILIQVPATHFAGIGHDATGAGTSLSSFCFIMQDQNAATVENYSMIIRGDNAGAPDCSATGVILQTAPVASPGGVGTLAWQITLTLTTPSTLLPLCATYYHGANVPANAGWTTDGLSYHISTYYIVNATAAGNPAPVGVPNLAWNCLAGAPVNVATARTIRFGLGVTASVLSLANTDPTLIGNTANCVSTLLNGFGNPRDSGIGGMYPQKGGGRDDGLDYRVRDLANANGVAVVFLGQSLGCPGLPLGGLANGALYLNPGGIFVQVAASAIDALGVAQGSILQPGQAPASIVSRVVDFQSFSLGPAFTLPGNLSNRASVNYLP